MQADRGPGPVLSRGPFRDRTARSCRHTVPDLTIRIGVKDRIGKLLLSQYVLHFWGPFQTTIACHEIKQEQPQDRKAILETLSLPVAKILSPVARQAPTRIPGHPGRPDPIYV